MSISSAIRKQSLNNLCIASNDEYNASARYVSFAAKADREGYLKVGSLFRAISRSEKIHAANLTAAMIKLGGTCLSAVEPVEVKSTVENLKAAIASELHEVKEVLPGFIREAESQAQFEALRTLKYAIASKRGHIGQFTSALEQMQHPQGKWAEILALQGGYFVCQSCGRTAEKASFDGDFMLQLAEDCAICDHPRDEFEMVD